MQSLNGIFQKDPSIVSRRIADEMVLVPIRRKVEEVACLYTAWVVLGGDALAVYPIGAAAGIGFIVALASGRLGGSSIVASRPSMP